MSAVNSFCFAVQATIRVVDTCNTQKLNTSTFRSSRLIVGKCIQGKSVFGDLHVHKAAEALCLCL